MAIKILPWPWGKNSPVIIRSDDVSFFTSKKMLLDVYSHALEKGYKVDFGVTPFLSGNAAARVGMKRNPRLAHLNFEPCIPPSVRGNAQKYDVSENKDLVNFLSLQRNNGKIDLSLHGYSHDLNDFMTNNSGKIETLLRMTIEKFSATFGFKPKILVFPYYQCSNKALEIASHLGLSLFFDRPISLVAKALKRIGVNQTAKKTRNDSIMLFSGNIVSVCSPVFSRRTPEEDYEYSRGLFTASFKKKKPFWIAHHFWEFYFDWQENLSEREFLESFNRLLDHIDEYEVWKCSTADLADWVLALKQLRIKRHSTNDIALKSDKPIAGLTLRIKGKLKENEKVEGLIKPLKENTYVLPYLPENKEIQIRCSD